MFVLVPSLIVLLPLWLAAGVLWFWIHRSSADVSGRRNPLTKDLLRGPGESLRQQMDLMTWDLAIVFGVSATPLLAGYSYYVSALAFTGEPPSIFVQTTLGALIIGLQAWLFWKIWNVLQLRNRLRLGYEAEVAVGQELNQLMRSGFHVFHDVPARDFNIDHVVVGPAGLFALETKGRPKRVKSGQGDGWEVSYDGDTLAFPGWTERKPLQQAERQAAWLAEWVSSSIGDKVTVQPVLVLPGWFIRRTSARGIPVLTGKQLAAYFSGARTRCPLDTQLIERIRHQLDQRCRDVIPRAYRKHSKEARD